MYRIRFLLLLLPLLAGCATRHAAPNLATAPIPALSYAAALDGGTVTPIQSPIIVKYAPYPTASFERLMRASGHGDWQRRSPLSSRMTGTTFAASSGDLVDITFAIEDVTSSPQHATDEKTSLLLKGAKITLLCRTLSASSGTSASPYRLRVISHTTSEGSRKVRGEFSEREDPPEGQDFTRATPFLSTHPSARHPTEGGTFNGKAS